MVRQLDQIKLGALYYLVEQGKEDEIEVRDFIKNNIWDRRKLCEVIDDSIVDHIIDNISPILLEGADFTTKSALQSLRRKKDESWWMSDIWIKGVPFKICFF